MRNIVPIILPGQPTTGKETLTTSTATPTILNAPNFGTQRRTAIQILANQPQYDCTLRVTNTSPGAKDNGVSYPWSISTTILCGFWINHYQRLVEVWKQSWSWLLFVQDGIPLPPLWYYPFLLSFSYPRSTTAFWIRLYPKQKFNKPLLSMRSDWSQKAYLYNYHCQNNWVDLCISWHWHIMTQPVTLKTWIGVTSIYWTHWNPTFWRQCSAHFVMTLHHLSKEDILHLPLSLMRLSTSPNLLLPI